MNIDHVINVPFEATSIKMSDYDEVHERMLFGESVDFIEQYRYEQ